MKNEKEVKEVIQEVLIKYPANLNCDSELGYLVNLGLNIDWLLDTILCYKYDFEKLPSNDEGFLNFDESIQLDNKYIKMIYKKIEEVKK